MKYLITLFILTSTLLANYNFQGQNSGKIDMHGGKTDKLSTGKSSFSKPSISPLGNISISKPSSPFAPKALIIEKKIKEEKKKEVKKIEKKEEK